MKIKRFISTFLVILFICSPLFIITIVNREIKKEAKAIEFVKEVEEYYTPQENRNFEPEIVDEEDIVIVYPDHYIAFLAIKSNGYDFIKSYSYSDKIIFDICIKDNHFDDHLKELAEYISYIMDKKSVLCLVDYNNREEVICYIDEKSIERI